MKQQLDDETRSAMVDYRLERAHSTLGEADLLYGGGYFAYCDASLVELLRPRSEAFIEAVEELTKRFPKQKAYDNNETE